MGSRAFNFGPVTIVNSMMEADTVTYTLKITSDLKEFETRVIAVVQEGKIISALSDQ